MALLIGEYVAVGSGSLELTSWSVSEVQDLSGYCSTRDSYTNITHPYNLTYLLAIF